MATIYIETSIPSYVVAKQPTDIVASARQLLAKEWWNSQRLKSQCYISDLVLLEASRGDANRAKLRLDLLKGIERLTINDEVRQLARSILSAHALPEKAREDALHISLAAVHGIDILLTWNCRHIANPFILSQIRKLVRESGHAMPEVATPEELLGGTQ